MSFKETYQKITDSEVFRNFIKEKPEAELCAGFFILDFISNDSKKAIDYKYKDKIYTFDLKDDGYVKMTEDELMNLPNAPPLLKINPEVKVEVEDLKGISGMEALDKGISAKFNKIIAVLQRQNRDGKEMQVWNMTCMLDGLIILNIQVDADSDIGKVIKFDRKSFMDMIKKK